MVTPGAGRSPLITLVHSFSGMFFTSTVSSVGVVSGVSSLELPPHAEIVNKSATAPAETERRKVEFASDVFPMPPIIVRDC